MKAFILFFLHGLCLWCHFCIICLKELFQYCSNIKYYVGLKEKVLPSDLLYTSVLPNYYFTLYSSHLLSVLAMSFYVLYVSRIFSTPHYSFLIPSSFLLYQEETIHTDFPGTFPSLSLPPPLSSPDSLFPHMPLAQTETIFSILLTCHRLWGQGFL